MEDVLTLNETHTMQKKIVEKFISLYNLGGTISSALWVIDENKKAKTNFTTTDKNVVGEITYYNFDLPPSELGVYNTEKLSKLLSVLSDDLEIDLNTFNDKHVSIKISDGQKDVNFALADKAAIPVSSNLKSLPDWDIVFNMNSGFIDGFIKAQGAMDKDSFALVTKGGKTNIVIGHSENSNNDKITFEIEPETSAEIPTLFFSSTYFKEILSANKNAEKGKLEIAGAGLARVTFETELYTAQYYLLQLQKES